MLDPELRDRLSEGGLRRVSEGFSPERLQERLDRVLTGILQDGPPGAPDAVRLAR